MSRRHDAGLNAVRRVRSVRENDSRIGLQRALAESRTRAEAAVAADARVRDAAPFGAGAVADFQAHVVRTAWLADARTTAQRSAELAERVAAEATVRWQQDKTAVRVTDLLLERRAAERAAERERRTRAELDDLAAVGWLRRRAAGEGR